MFLVQIVNGFKPIFCEDGAAWVADPKAIGESSSECVICAGLGVPLGEFLYKYGDDIAACETLWRKVRWRILSRRVRDGWVAALRFLELLQVLCRHKRSVSFQLRDGNCVFGFWCSVLMVLSPCEMLRKFPQVVLT